MPERPRFAWKIGALVVWIGVVMLALCCAARPLRADPARSLTPDVGETVRLVCHRLRLETSIHYQACLTREWAAARAFPLPDLDRLQAVDAFTIRVACMVVRPKGTALFHKCLAEQVAESTHSPSPGAPLPPDVLDEAYRLCADLRPRGVAAYNDCLWRSVGNNPVP